MNLSVFSLIIGITELKTLTKHISCECNCRFDERKCNSDQWWNNDRCWCKCKKRHVCEKNYIWNPATSSCENGNYLVIITDDSAIASADIMKPYNKETNFNGKKATYKTQNFYILLTFSLITLDYWWLLVFTVIW